MIDKLNLVVYIFWQIQIDCIDYRFVFISFLLFRNRNLI